MTALAAFAASVTVAMASLAATGCTCGRDRDRPYTPFRIGGASATPSGSALPVPAPGASAAPFPREATPVPGDTNRFSVDGVPVEVAPERVLERALGGDFDGDGEKDAVVWTRARAETLNPASTGELVFFGGKTPAGRVVGTMPPFVPSGPGCRHTVTLLQTGPRTVTLDVAAHCDAALVPRSPTRGVTVIAPAAERPTVVALRLADPAPAESLTLLVDSRDSDADGRDDVRATVTLRAETNAGDAAATAAAKEGEASADLVWLDRAAGPSRDSAEPARSLGSLSSVESARTAGKATSARIVLRIGNARRLATTLCAEGGAPRIFDADGAPLPCSGLDPALQSLASAEVHAEIVRHDLGAAVAAFGRDGWYGPAVSAKARGALEKELLAATDRRTATPLPLDVTPRARSGLPRFSPLAFEADGALLVQTLDGISRVRFPDGHVEDASEGLEPWPLTVGGGAAPRWTGIAFPCDRSEIVLLESDAAGTPLPSAPTRLLAPRPGPCRHGGTLPTPDLVPLEWTEERTAGFVGGGLFGAATLAELRADPPRGSPRSPDGKSLVMPWSQGLLVLGGAKPASWSAPLRALTDCVVANGAAAVACVQGDRAVAFTPSAPLLPEKAGTKASTRARGR